MPRKIKISGPTQKITPVIEKRVYLRVGKLTGDTADMPSLSVAANEGINLWCFLMEHGWTETAQKLADNYAGASDEVKHAVKRAFERFNDEMRDSNRGQEAGKTSTAGAGKPAKKQARLAS